MEYIITNKKNDIKDFIKKYKNKKFTIKNKDEQFQVKLIKEKSVITPKLSFYCIQTIELSTNENVKYVFKISFNDPLIHKPSFEKVYINNISKSEKYSGSEVVKFVIDFLKSFKQIKKAYLYDGSEVSCKNSNDKFDLSLYKLITSHLGFYQKFGFRLVTDNDEDIDNRMIKIARKVSNYKVSDILRNFEKIIRLIEKHKENVFVKKINSWDKTLQEEKLNEISKYMFNLGYLYYSLSGYRGSTFGECMKKMNENKCFMVSQIFDCLVNDTDMLYVEFKSGKEKIKSIFLYDFYKLCIYRKNYQWKGMYCKSL